MAELLATPDDIAACDLCEEMGVCHTHAVWSDPERETEYQARYGSVYNPPGA